MEERRLELGEPTHFHVGHLTGGTKTLVIGRRYRLKSGRIHDEDWKTAIATRQPPLVPGDVVTFTGRLDNMYGRSYKLEHEVHGLYYASLANVELEELAD